ncbi:Protein fantom [Rhizoclosmatium sp. JEL0117]|nr:Protein fantom [Rhizoclosmatium sp. JEL0117]
MAAERDIAAATLALENGDGTRAATLLTKAIAVAPSAALFDLRAAVFAKLGNTDAALRDANSVVQLDPHSPVGYLRAARIFRKKGLNDAAFKICRIGVSKIRSNDPDRKALEGVYLDVAGKLGISLKRQKKENAAPSGQKQPLSKPQNGGDPGVVAPTETEVIPLPPPLPTIIHNFGSHSIPFEIIQAIFELLPLKEITKCLRLSSSIRAMLSNNKFLWRDLDLSKYSHKVTDTTITSLMLRGRDQIRTIVLKDCSKVTKAGIRAVSNSKSKLSCFEFTFNRKVASELLVAAVRAYSGDSIRRVNLSGTSISDEGIGLLLDKCSGLEEMSLSECPSLTDASLNTTLRLVLSHKQQQLQSDEPTAVSIPLYSLKSLDVSNNPNLSDKLGGNVARCFPSLTTIVLDKLPLMTNRTLEALALHCKQMESVSATGITFNYIQGGEGGNTWNTSMLLMAKECKNLKAIRIGSCKFVEDAGLDALTALCHNLEVLELNKLINLDISANPRITDKTMEALCVYGKGLVELNMSGCGLTGASILQFAKMKSEVGKAGDRQEEDEVYKLRSENLSLKKKLNLQDDRAKKLTVKVQRLSEDLVRNKEIMAGDDSKLGKPKPIKGEFKNIEEAYSLIEDLRDQLKELTKENTVTRNKMQYFRTLHEAESRKRTPYDHIPPRIQGQSAKKRLHPSLVVKSKPGGMASARTSGNPSPEPPQHHNQEELDKLEEMNGMLRLKLGEADAEVEKAKQESIRFQEALEKDQHQHEIDRAALQLELADSRKRERELAGKYDALDERFRAMLEAHQEALRVSDELNADLKEERRRCVEMEHEVKKAYGAGQENAELLALIDDLREEKRLLEQEQANLLDAQFNRDREEEYQHEIEELRDNLRKHIQDLAFHLDEKRAIHEENESLKEHLRELRDEKHDTDKRMFEIQQELDELREKMNFFCKNGEIDISEIEEALSIVRLRRERGISLDFLLEAEELYADKEVLQELRVQYADCIHELEKVRKLLYLQEHINKDYKLECEELNRKMEALKNGYELRLEEDSRLLDLRSNKIALLEGQLKSIVYGTAKVPAEIEKPKDDDDIVELATGQNLIEIHIESALISDDGMYHIRKLGLDMEDSAKLTTFIHYDFFEFETQVSPMGLSQKPVFNFTSKYKVYTDDFFLQYLQSKHTVLNFAVSNGVEFFNVGTCNVVMKELTDPDRTDRLRYYADLISNHDNRTIIGKVDFGLRVRLPMAQAIRSFKERTVALNLLTVSDKEVSSRRFRPRADTNDLVIRIISCSHLRQPPGRIPAVFASFQFYIHETMVTDTIRNSTSPLLNFLRILPLPMTSDLDRYLRTANLHIMILDDNDGIEDFEYGSVSVPLLPLALGEKIYDEYFLTDGFGNGKSKVTISLEWSKPYKLNVVPLISQLDEQAASSQDRSNRAVHSQDDGEEDSEKRSQSGTSRTDVESDSMDKFEEKKQKYKRRNFEDMKSDDGPSRPQESESESTAEGSSSVEKANHSKISKESTTTGKLEEVRHGSSTLATHKSSSELRKQQEAHSTKTSKANLVNEKHTFEPEINASDGANKEHKKPSVENMKSAENLQRVNSEGSKINKDKSKSQPQLKSSSDNLQSQKASSHKSMNDITDSKGGQSKASHELKHSKDELRSSKKALEKVEKEENDPRKISLKSLREEEAKKDNEKQTSHKSSQKSLAKDEKHSKSKESVKDIKRSKADLAHSKSKDGLADHRSSQQSLDSSKSSKESVDKDADSESKSHRDSTNSCTSQLESKNSDEDEETSDLKKSSRDEDSSELKSSSKSSASKSKSSKSKTSSSSKQTKSTSDEETSSHKKSSNDEESSDLKSTSKSSTSKSKSSTSKTSSSTKKSVTITDEEDTTESHDEEDSSENKTSASKSSKSKSSKSKTDTSSSKEPSEKSDSGEADEESTSEEPDTTYSKSSSTSSLDSLHSAHKSKNSSSESLISNSSDTVKPKKSDSNESLPSSSSSRQSSILSDAERSLFRSSDESNSRSKHSGSESQKDTSSSKQNTTTEEETTDTHNKSSESLISTDNDNSETSSVKDTRSTLLTIRLEEILFKTQSPKTSRLLRNVNQFFVSFEFLNYPPEELETHSIQRDDSGAHAITYSKTFSLHPFKNERTRHDLTRVMNSRDQRDTTVLFTVVSEPTEDSDPDSECEDIAFAKLDLLELADESINDGIDSVRKELQVWDANGDILMGTLVVFVKGISILAECLE